MVRKFGQAGLDFLMTYGWALLIIVLVVGVLFSLGVFNTSSFTGSRASGFASVGVSAWKVSPGASGALTMIVTNRVGAQIDLTSINCTFDNGVSSTFSTITPISNGASSGTLTFTTAPNYAVGDSYSSSCKIYYVDTKSAFNYSDAGALTGRATN